MAKKKMKKWSINASVIGSRHIGTYEANTLEEAIELAWRDASCSLCHQCSSECEDPEIGEMYGEEIK